ncbi:hypothetical protein T10_697 [Trichinella papuae]|uniref:Uncharacterized protein n=1 Tax=Trichinella papuae TaxID=268474 RepID=A0A0V1LYK5_9BILA|nr:hypothetical protein T10_697 [Trichinella papuae]
MFCFVAICIVTDGICLILTLKQSLADTLNL